MTFEITITATVKPEFEAKGLEIGYQEIIDAWSSDVKEMLSYNDKVFDFHYSVLGK